MGITQNPTNGRGGRRTNPECNVPFQFVRSLAIEMRRRHSVRPRFTDFTNFTEVSNIEDTAGMNKHRLKRYKLTPTLSNNTTNII